MDVLRNSPFGYLTRLLSNNILLQLPPVKQVEQSDDSYVRDTTNHEDDLNTKIVGWYGSDDPENPQNWGAVKKYAIGLLMCLYTFSVYVGSAIYTPGETEVMTEFHVGSTTSSLGLAIYVLAYGIGTLLFSPLSEIPIIGRTTPYIITFAIFVILLVPTALVQNFAGFLVLRFLLAFFGSPCLATSGATFQDVFSPSQVPYVIATWSAVATCGPALGPLLTSYSIPVKGWRWSHWEMLWLAGPVLLIMLIILPETSSSTLLMQRARRLRRETGDDRFKSQAEIDQHKMTLREVLFDALIKPWEVNILDPAVLFTTFFTGVLYGIVYTWFEVFPIVYEGIYGFDQRNLGLAYLAVFIAVLVWVPTYMAWFRFGVEKRIREVGLGPPEDWLVIGLWGGWLIPVGLFIFAFTSRKEVHWIVSLFGVALANIGMSAGMQSMFLYVPFCYPKYAASLLSANALSRSLFATAAILYAPAMFKSMGVAGGVGMLAGLTVVCYGGLWFLYLYGSRLRERSRFAMK